MYVLKNVRSFKKSIRIFKYTYATAPLPVKQKWGGIVNDAEKVVGYPTSFLNLRWLLNDEIANVALHMTKLIGTNHPILNVAREFIQPADSPKWGLIVLLVSKAAGVKIDAPEIEQDKAIGILHSQRSLAEVTEMIKTGHSLHNVIMNIEKDNENYKDLNAGNKLALLSGDYLYSKCFHEISRLNNSTLEEFISYTLRDLAQCDFFGPQNDKGIQIPYKPEEIVSETFSKILSEFDIEITENDKAEWVIRNILGSSNVLARSCKGSLLLGGHSEFLQNEAYKFGQNLGLAWKATEELIAFEKDIGKPFSLVSAPVIFHLHRDPTFNEIFEPNVNYKTVRQIILNGPGIPKTKEIRQEYINKALGNLSHFPEADAKSALENILLAL